jgi:uncharacterized protein (TIGR02246 family)
MYLKNVVIYWLNTLMKHNLEEIVNLYALDGILLGTFSKNMKIGHSEIMSYFEHFFLKRPTGEFTSINVQHLGSDYGVVDGTYTFNLMEDDDTIRVAPARYTFVLRRINDEWKIASHHSSVQPI